MEDFLGIWKGIASQRYDRYFEYALQKQKWVIFLSFDYEEEGYKKGFREGTAVTSLRIVENMIKDYYKDEYDLIKYKIRRLSEYEAKLLLDEYFEGKEFKSLYEVI